MGSMKLLSRAAQAAPNASPPTAGGCICAECSHIGCCDNSPHQHASHHHAETGHPIITSFEPGEDWFYDYRTQDYVEGPELSAPDSHPVDQPTPGPRGKMPHNWQSLLH
jgi:hypothetical protein